MIKGAYTAWLQLLQRVHNRREQQRDLERRIAEERRKTRDGWKGQGMVEYALILVLVIIVVVVVGTLVLPYASPQTPPAMNAPLLDVVRWCESHARESYTTSSMSMTKVGNVMIPHTTTTTHWKDAPDKFISCMAGYEYSVKR